MNGRHNNSTVVSREKRNDLLTCFDDIKFQEDKERWSAYLFWRYQVSRGERKIICLPVLTISSFKKIKKDDLLTCFDDIKFQEEKERWYANLFWRYQVSRGKRKMICLPVLTILSFKRRKKDDMFTCYDDVKFQEEKEISSAYLFWRCQISRGERNIICLPVLTMSRLKRRKKRSSTYLIWRCQV